MIKMTEQKRILLPNIQVSTAWLEDPSYINTTKKPSIEGLPATTDYKPTPSEPDNNVMRMIKKMSDPVAFEEVWRGEPYSNRNL